MNSIASSTFAYDDDAEKIDSSSLHHRNRMCDGSSNSILNFAADLNNASAAGASVSMNDDILMYHQPSHMFSNSNSSQQCSLQDLGSKHVRDVATGPTNKKQHALSSAEQQDSSSTTTTTSNSPSTDDAALYLQHTSFEGTGSSREVSDFNDSFQSLDVKEPPRAEQASRTNAADDNVTSPTDTASSEKLLEDTTTEYLSSKSNPIHIIDTTDIEEDPAVCKMLLNLTKFLQTLDATSEQIKQERCLKGTDDDEESYFDDGSMFGPDSIQIAIARHQRRRELLRDEQEQDGYDE